MSAYANSVQKPERFDMYVRKFRSICMMHEVQIGSRKELPAFLRKLIDDRHLAMDFWGFIGKTSNREGGELSDDQVLGVIVEGITESDISEQDGGTQGTISDLRAMLSGVDIQGPEQSQVEMAPFPPSAAASQADAGQLEKQLWTHAEELATSEKQAPSAPETLGGESHHGATLGATPAPQLDEALLRLELTRLVQQYFDNIDKRISKLEPPSGEATGTIAPSVTRRSLEEPISLEEMEELRLRRMGRTRLVLEPAPSPVEASLPALDPKDDDDIPMRVPLEHYSPPERYGKAPLLLVLVLIGAGFAIYRDPTLVRKGFSLAVRQFHIDRRGAAASDRNATQSPPSTAETPVKTEESQPSRADSALEGTSTPPPANPQEQTTSSAGSQPASNASDSDNSRQTMTERAVAQTEQAIAAGVSSIESAGAIRVNPSVMDENLIVQRVPAYPESAKISGVEGDVVMDALISKEGTVKRVHVMEGDSRLRSAAEEAVYKWRYRPYVLHGRPVEVATTVTVNFNLDRR